MAGITKEADHIATIDSTKFASLNIESFGMLADKPNVVADPEPGPAATKMDASDPATIARELHDGVMQDLCCLRFQAQALAARLNASRSAESHSAEMLAEQAELALASLRRAINNLRPTLAENIDLPQAILRFASNIEQESGMQVQVVNQLEGNISSGSEIHVFRIAQEAVRNAVRHSQATAIKIRLKSHGQFLGLRVVDNGIGLDSSRPRAGKQIGLSNMRHRTDLLGGAMLLWSRNNLGTIVQAVVPKCA